MLLIVKEIFIGLVLGWLIALPFWIFEAIGFIVDNQRGATLGGIIDPATGNDSSPIAPLFHEAFIVLFLVGGGFAVMLTMLYDSYLLWDLRDWAPTLHRDSIPLMLDKLSGFARMVLLFSAPAIVAMFLAEFGLALISRFAPQLQVFFLSMPIKSGLALLVLVLYMNLLFDYVDDSLQGIPNLLTFLDGQWRRP